MTTSRVFRRIATVLIGTALVGAGLAATSPPTWADSTGGGTGGPAYVVPAADRTVIAQEERTRERLVAQLDAGRGTAGRPLTMPVDRSGSGSRVTMCPPERPHCIPASQPVRFFLAVVNHREGQGNPCTPGSAGCSRKGHKYYTCAAASTRNMVETLTGVDKSELYYEKALAIDVHGLHGIAHIPQVLNRDFRKQRSKFGVWHAVTPQSASDYLARVVASTRGKGHAVIQNVATSKLGYFGKADLTHYNLVYGYNTERRWVAIAEEWDPHFTFGQLDKHEYVQGNPYGKIRNFDAGQAFNAVASSPNRRIVE